MVRVLAAFLGVVLDQQPVVAIGVDMQVAVAGEADHLHRQLVGDAVVEQQGAVGRPDLGALVADDRLRQLEPFHPVDGAAVRPAGAGRDLQSASASRRQRGLVAGVDGEVQANDRAVEVEGQQPVAAVSAGYRGPPG